MGGGRRCRDHLGGGDRARERSAILTGQQGGFDPATGSLVLDDGTVVGPGVTRSAFLASSLADGASELIVNEPHASWSVARAITGRPFRLGLFFEAARLTMVVGALDESEFGREWSDWSREGELARKAAHEAWLAPADPAIGDGRDYPWGFVASVLDEKSGGAEIVIRYGARSPERRSPSPIRLDPST